MKPMGPPPAFKQELRNEKIRIGDKITLTCQGENCLNQKVITNSVEQSHLLLMEAECHHFHRTLPSNLSLKQLDPAHILTLGLWRSVRLKSLNCLYLQLCSLMFCVCFSCPGYIGAPFLELLIQTRLLETRDPLSMFPVRPASLETNICRL